MHLLLRSIACLLLLAGNSLAAFQRFTPRAPSDTQNVVYWGQNAPGENINLATYCTNSSGIDIIILAFLYQYGDGTRIPSGAIGQSCSIKPTGDGEHCDDIAKAIDTCKSNGVKVVLSLGGGISGGYSLSFQEEAEAIGQNLWDVYGNTKSKTIIPRPFGETFVSGWDFNIENSRGSQYYQFLIARLRSNFASDSNNQYIITGAPQCPIPEPNMDQIITKAKFDYIWVQFYNNPSCSGNSTFNYDDWKRNIANSTSAKAELFIGVPASPIAATGDEKGEIYYLRPNKLADVVRQYWRDCSFGGIMMWSAGFSSSNLNDTCNYAQQAKRILTTGQGC